MTRKAYVFTKDRGYAAVVTVIRSADYDAEVRAAARDAKRITGETAIVCTCGSNDDQDAAVASFKAMRERVAVAA